MKKLLLATAIAALSVSAANAAPTVYGKAFLTLDLVEADVDVSGPGVNENVNADERTSLNSNASRIGLKGSEALTANTDLLYQLEYGVDVDADSDQFYSRDTYLGLQNAEYGTLLAGRLTAIDDYVNFANVTQGGVLGDDAVLASFDAPRVNNSFAYFTPSYGNMQFMAMYGLDEDNFVGEENIAGVAGKYAMGPMNAGLSYIQASGDVIGDFKKAIRVSGNYAVNPALTVGALYQNTDLNTDDNENAFTLSGEMKTATPWTAYAQADVVSNYGGDKDGDALRGVVGGKYAINAATTGHVYGAYLNEEYDDGTNKADYDGFGIGGGIEYKF
ncbi:porin [Psychrobacter celer]|uniref:porin n=1 Tax=Psychrobacter celer TaxID=306572 RepID=UPI003FD29990